MAKIKKNTIGVESVLELFTFVDFEYIQIVFRDKVIEFESNEYYQYSFTETHFGYYILREILVNNKIALIKVDIEKQTIIILPQQALLGNYG